MNQELQVKIDRIKELAEKYKEIKSVDVDGVEVINMKNHVDSKEITEYLNLVMPPTVLELIDEFHKIEMHEHYMEQWADYDMEQAHKTVDWVCELQRILGFEEIGETKNTRAEITEKVKELVAESKRAERLEKEADWLAEKLEHNVPLLHEDAGWREAAKKAVSA